MARKPLTFDPAAFKTAAGDWNQKALQAEVRRFAKAANQRLLSLEKANLASSTAYQYAAQSIASGAPGTLKNGVVPRFRERTGRSSTTDLLRQMQAMERFLNSRMSSVRTVKKVYKQGTQNLINYAKHHGIDLSPDLISKLLASYGAGEVAKRYGYAFVLLAAKDMEEHILERQEEADEPGENYIVNEMAKMFNEVLDPEKNQNLLTVMESLQLSDDVKKAIKKKAKINPKTGRPKLPKSV